MKRGLALLLLLAALWSLCACGEVPLPAEEDTVPPAEAPFPEAAETDPASLEALQVLLGELRQNVSIATAGSSLRAAAMAARLLDWGETARIGDGDLQAALAPWLEPPDDGVPADFREQLAAVNAAVERLTGPDEEQARGLLRDAGCEDCGYPWSPEAVALVRRLLALAGPEGND